MVNEESTEDDNMPEYVVDINCLTNIIETNPRQTILAKLCWLMLVLVVAEEPRVPVVGDYSD